jgi:hypothetical protein
MDLLKLSCEKVLHFYSVFFEIVFGLCVRQSSSESEFWFSPSLLFLLRMRQSTKKIEIKMKKNCNEI